ncbi:MAG: hypothetical protein HY744_07065 [Deltaproteobacteria bacterium]|nr:hypothetical protein [Deltaproteobacteria bacterium]
MLLATTATIAPAHASDPPHPRSEVAAAGGYAQWPSQPGAGSFLSSVQPGSAPGAPYGAWRMPEPQPYAPPAAPKPLRAPYPPSYYPAPAAPVAAPAPAADAPADPKPDEPAPPFLDLAVGTLVPLTIGGLAGLELPGRLLIQAEVGWMPPAYGAAVGGLVQRFAPAGVDVATLMQSAIERAMVVRISGGWRPFASAGFEILGGYTYLSVSGTLSPAYVAGLVGVPVPADAWGELLQEDIALGTQLHNFHVAVGWRWVAWNHRIVRANIGYTQTIRSSTTIEIPSHPEIAALAGPTIDQTLDGIYTQYVKLPVLGLSAGYRF